MAGKRISKHIGSMIYLLTEKYANVKIAIIIVANEAIEKIWLCLNFNRGIREMSMPMPIPASPLNIPPFVT